MKYVAVLFLLICSFLIPPSVNAQYRYPWPGILPDHPFIKSKFYEIRLSRSLFIAQFGGWSTTS